MMELFNRITAKPLPIAGALAAGGAALGFLGLGTPGAVLFMLSGLLVMVASGRHQQPRG